MSLTKIKKLMSPETLIKVVFCFIWIAIIMAFGIFLRNHIDPKSNHQERAEQEQVEKSVEPLLNHSEIKP